MSIIIKGMDMPTSCWGCEIFSSCPTGSLNECLKYVESRNPNCPLIEIPTPHGRLIDEGLINKQLGVAEECEDCKFWNGTCERGANRYICDILYDAPTILEAEE